MLNSFGKVDYKNTPENGAVGQGKNLVVYITMKGGSQEERQWVCPPQSPHFFVNGGKKSKK
jgi:hypothetical protein